MEHLVNNHEFFIFLATKWRALPSDEEQEARCVEHFQEVLNQPTPSMLFRIDWEMPALTLKVTSDDITGAEVCRLIKSLKTTRHREPMRKLLNCWSTVRRMLWKASPICPTWCGMLKSFLLTGEVGSSWRCQERETFQTATTGGTSHYCLSLARYSVVCCSNV